MFEQQKLNDASVMESTGAVAFILLMTVLLWVGATTHAHTSLQQDLAEQFVWAHAWQWGYPKHPPLPTWLFMSVLELLPPRPATLYGLSGLCIGLTGVFTYLLSRELMGRPLALPVILLWSLQQPFSWRAWQYNHNTVLVMCLAATAWCVFRAQKSQGFWWLAAGLAAGLTLLTKIQALVPLAGIVWALWRSAAFDQPSTRKGMLFASVVALLAVSPWLIWVAAGHRDVLMYASHQLGGDQGEAANMHFMSFVGVELRMLSPALLALLIWAGIKKWRRAEPSPRPALTATQRGWLEGLCAVPIVSVLVTGLLTGATLHGSWGVQTFQFVALALVVGLRPMIQSLSACAQLGSVAVLHVLGLAMALAAGLPGLHKDGPFIGYPGRALAVSVERDWRAATHCPLRYVVSPFVEGGVLSAYIDTHPAVLEDGEIAKSPWIDLNDLKARGGVVLVHNVAELPPHAIHRPDMTLVPRGDRRFASPVFWAIQPPPVDCPPSADPGTTR